MSKVVLTLEFPSILAAADALNLISGSKVQQLNIVLPAVPATVPNLVDAPTTDTTQVATVTPTAPDPQSLPTAPVDKPARKPRADAGKPRGPHKSGEPAASEPGTGAVNSVAAQTPAAPATPSQSAAPAPSPSQPQAQPQAASAPAAVDPSAKPTKEDATEALGRINKTVGMGMPACIEHMKLFGVNRISLLPETSYALFIKQADEKIAEHLAAAAKK